MKRILTALFIVLTITLNADGIEQRFSEAQLLDIGIAGIECFDRHPILKLQAREVLAYATDIATYKMQLTPDLFEKAVFEIGAFRKNVKKLCGTYNGNAINDALALTGWDMEATYELVGYIASIVQAEARWKE